MGLDTGSEVADHVALLLRFLSLLDDQDQARELAGEALLPTLQRMTRTTEGDDESPDEDPGLADPGDDREAYRRVLHALRLVLERHAPASPEGQEDEPAAASSRRDDDAVALKEVE